MREGDKRSRVLVNLHPPSMSGQEAAAVQSEGAGGSGGAEVSEISKPSEVSTLKPRKE